ncbi:MAG: ABC transporter permease subunit [Clostridia bacterium]|nr:ABC transporter permease subunit [Clostridia bacterium]
MSQNQKKKMTLGSSFTGMFKRLFKKEQLSALEEEAIQTPLQTIIKNYFRNKLGVIGLVMFIGFLLFAFLGSRLNPIELTYTELPNANLAPGLNYLKVNKDVTTDNVKQIVSGVSFSVALKEDGSLSIWGTEPNQKLSGVSDYVMEIPEEVKNAHIVQVATGGKHVLALDDEGNLYGWGYYGHGQTTLPEDIQAEIEESGASIKQLLAATMWSAVVTDDQNIYIWGSSQSTMNFKVGRKVKGHVVSAATADNNMALLLDDGTITIIGDKSSEFYLNMPEELSDGSVQVVDVKASNRNVIALDSEERIYVWGANQDGLNSIPDGVEGHVKSIDAGYRHFVAVLDDGTVTAWGSDALKQIEVPSDVKNVDAVFVDYYQNYAINSTDGKIYTWGNKGYVFGSDEYGRDMLGRLIHGGRISLTVGAIAMIISTIIALFVGLTAGYFGGWVDHVLMRLADVFSAIPFYPIAVTLSYTIGTQLAESQRLYLIMVVLGVLSWMGLARLVRAQLLVEREKDFVLAARALGIKQGNIMWKHILPNVFNLVIVNITLGYASSLLTEAGLSFLGFGVSQPTPSWGNMLTSAQSSVVIQYYWWRWFLPGLFVVLAALSANLIGDALREAMDPRENER